MSNNGDGMVVSIPSDFKYLGAIDAAIQDLAREFAFSQDSINDLSTALIEACSNAIEHGNKFATDKRVQVSLSFEQGSFVGRIRDQGAGFDYDAALSSNAPPDPMSERGRGLMIMQAFCDGLAFSFDEGEGLCVELKKSADGHGDDEGGD